MKTHCRRCLKPILVSPLFLVLLCHDCEHKTIVEIQQWREMQDGQIDGDSQRLRVRTGPPTIPVCAAEDIDWSVYTK